MKYLLVLLAFALFIPMPAAAAGLKLELTAANHELIETEISGLSKSVLADLNTGDYTLEFFVVDATGNSQEVMSVISESLTKKNAVHAKVYMIRTGREAVNQPVSPSTYTLRAVLYKMVPGNPYYVQVPVQESEVKSNISFRWPSPTNLKKIEEPVARIDTSTLNSSSAKPKLKGYANVDSLYYTIEDLSYNKTFFTSKKIKVKNGDWKSTVSKKLPNGSYKIRLHATKPPIGVLTDILDGGTLIVSTEGESKVTFKATVPKDGIARANQTVTLADVVISNPSKGAVVVEALWLKNKGTASESAIRYILSGVPGNTSGTAYSHLVATSPERNAIYIMSSDWNLEPGESKTFTVAAELNSSLANDIGKTLGFDIYYASTGASVTGLPVKGATYTIGR
ncbi:MAG: hypothetical protein V4682_01155 [Patescibacteria group bacterium]